MSDPHFLPGSIQARVMESIRTGKPIVAHKLEDREMLEWISKQITGKTYKFAENHRRIDGLVDKFAKPTVVVYDCPQLHRGDVAWLHEKRAVQDWLLSITDGGGQGAELAPGVRESDARPLRIIATVHPEDWQMTVDTLTSLGYFVENGDAVYTHPMELFVGHGVPL